MEKNAATCAARERDRLPFVGEERHEAKRRERADGEPARRVKVFDQCVGEIGGIDARDRHDAGDRDTHETQRGRHAAGDIAAQQRVEETDPERGDEDRKGTTKEGTRRYTDERDRRRLRDEHERRRDRIDRDEQREHEHERRRDLREWMRLR